MRESELAENIEFIVNCVLDCIYACSETGDGQASALLQGVTYHELAELIGTAPHEVNFYLPATNIPILRRVEGFEDFDPINEVLHCDKPGTGSVDAPRAFSMKLKQILTNEAHMKPSKIDNELLYRHDSNNNLVGMMAIHVDDLKITGETGGLLR